MVAIVFQQRQSVHYGYPHQQQIAWDSSLSQGLVFHASLQEQGELAAYDAVDPIHQSSGIIHPGLGPVGYGRYRTSGTTLDFPLRDRHKFGTNPFSLAVYGVLTSAAQANNLISNNTSTGRANQWRILSDFNGTSFVSGTMCFYTYGGGAASQISAANMLDAESPHWYTAVRQSDGKLQLWRDSVLFAESSALTVRDVSGSLTDNIGMGYANTAGTNGRAITRGSAWNRALRPWEIAELATNPNILTVRRPVYSYAAAASSLPTLSASTYVPGSVTATGWRPRVTATY